MQHKNRRARPYMGVHRSKARDTPFLLRTHAMRLRPSKPPLSKQVVFWYHGKHVGRLPLWELLLKTCHHKDTYVTYPETLLSIESHEMAVVIKQPGGWFVDDHTRSFVARAMALRLRYVPVRQCFVCLCIGNSCLTNVTHVLTNRFWFATRMVPTCSRSTPILKHLVTGHTMSEWLSLSVKGVCLGSASDSVASQFGAVGSLKK